MKTCYIMGAMPTKCSFKPGLEDLVIAADGGLATLERMGTKPDMVLGDFDSLGHVPKGENVVTFPVEKDDTDTMLACKLGLEQGYREFVIGGGIGGRLDHTIANIQTLLYLKEKGADAVLVGDRESLLVIRNEAISLPAREEGIVSVFAIGGEAQGVSIHGLCYEAEQIDLTPAFPLGVSNHFCGTAGFIEVKKGTLLIVIGNEETTDG